MIHQTERDDFNQILADAGRDPSDFELIENENPMTGTGVQPITGTVSVRRKSNKLEKVYRAWNVSRWPAEFAADLRKGAFD